MSDDKVDGLLRNRSLNNSQIRDLIERTKKSRINKELRNELVLCLSQLLSLRASVYLVNKGVIEPCELLAHATARGILKNVVLDEVCSPMKGPTDATS